MAAASGWLKGKVKAVPSGDTLVIMAGAKGDSIPPEKSITLSSIIAPRLVRRVGTDEPFAWESREFLRKLCIGQVKEQGQKVNESPYFVELLRLENSAKEHGLGRWTKEPKDSTRCLPTSSFGEVDAKDYVAKNKGQALEAIVEQVRDGSTLRVYFLPSFDFVQIYVAGVQAPSMGRRGYVPSSTTQTEVARDDKVNREVSAEAHTPSMAVEPPCIYSEIPPDQFGREAKHFTETRVLNREVRVVLEGTDSFSNIFGSVYFSDGNAAKDLALELVENGYAKYMEWSANMLGREIKTKLKNADLQAKKEQLRMWTGFKPPATNTRPIYNTKFTGRVIEIVNGSCIIVADDATPSGSPSTERRINLSSIRTPKLANPSGEIKIIQHFAVAAKEFMRTRLIGKEVNVSMEYSRRIDVVDGQTVAHKTNTTDRVLDYGSVFLPSQAEGVNSASNNSIDNPLGVNVAELLLSRGLVDIIRHRDYEERSHHYDSLLAAHSRAEKGKKGYHSKKDYPVTHMTDLTMVPAKKAREFIHMLQQKKRHNAIVEYVFSGHRFKLTIPKETMTITFSFSGVRCPGKNEPYSNDAIALMRRRILQRDVEVQIETVDKTGTFLGSLWESNTDMAFVLEHGLAKPNTGLGRIPDVQTLMRAEQFSKMKKLKVWENYNGEEVIPQGSVHGQKKRETLKVSVTEVLGGGKFYVQIVGDHRLASIQQQLASLEFNDPSETNISKNSSDTPSDPPLKDQDQPKNSSLNALEVKDEPKNHAVPLLSNWSRLFKDQPEISKGEVPLDNPEDKAPTHTFEANQNSEDAPFKPVKGDMVLAQFSLDYSWNRALIVSEHQGAAEPEFKVYYIDYGNQELVPYSHLRHVDQSISSIPPLAKLCSLAFITVPNLKDDLGEQAAEHLSGLLLDNEKEFIAIVEERCNVGAKMEGQGTGEMLMVTLVDDEEDTEININGAMLESGLAQILRKKSDSWERRNASKNLEKFQEHARKGRRGIWRVHDVPEKSTEDGKVAGANEDEDLVAPARAPPPSRGFDLIKFIAYKSHPPKVQQD
ncbi:hypothetical protein PR202_ga20469 [Eleusine coracana subsp. coracana]|uniref:Ribonuclease n=1 Tax=Eleusine coracana subsp. coracana TaxID=191504 RepID=A0AAV5CYE6_ELECO|nr:hypothetical protein QOZ80_4AG0319080 [Eleusine coracana subsp. coracana]GJN03066.1 hypothetical protein PR202_ga20469 [Eleusine coracana subsp. coracana]